jgi:hypothetical protein
MASRYWVVGGEYEGPDFRVLVPGTETMVGPFADECRARTEWIRLSHAPDTGCRATLRYSIAAEGLH